MNKKLIYAAILLFSVLILGCGNKNNQPNKKSVQTVQKQLAIKTSTVSYVSGQDTVKAFLAQPDTGKNYPALIVIHEWWGLKPWIMDNAESFARKGYVALAIDLYRGKSTSNPAEASKLMRSVPQNRAVTDLKTAFNYLQNLPDVNKNRIGAIGWCMGGGYALKAALNIPQLAACQINYGELTTEKSEIDKINCPVLGIFGKKDNNIKPETVKEFQDIANQKGKDVHTIIYPGVSHAFMNPNNISGYSEKISRKAWEQIYTFLDTTLKK